MRIAQMLDTLHMGGAQKMQIFLAQCLCPLGVEVTVINLGESPNEVVVSELKKAGARVVTIPFRRMFSPISFLKLVRFLKSEKFDLLQAYLTYSNIIGSLAGSLAGTPVIGSLRNAGYHKEKVRRARIVLENLTLKYLASRVTANGYSVGEFAKRRLGNIPVDIIVNSVDVIPPLAPEERDRVRHELTGDSSRPIIFSAGRLTPQKGFQDLLEAYRTVALQHPGTNLVIAGTGSLEEELRSMTRQFGLQENVLFLGFREDITRLMAAADIYVNSSHWEGTPVSVLEAMAAGLPVVATTVGDNPYLLDGNSGVLVPPGNAKELSEAIECLLASPDDRIVLGKVARERVQEKYSRTAWTRSLLTLYSQISPPAKAYLELAEKGSAL